MEGPVSQMFMRMIEWYIGTETKFSVSFGKSGKLMEKYLSAEDLYKNSHYLSRLQIENIWKSLFIMTSMFNNYAKQVADNLQFNKIMEEHENVKEFLQRICLIQQCANEPIIRMQLVCTV